MASPLPSGSPWFGTPAPLTSAAPREGGLEHRPGRQRHAAGDYDADSTLKGYLPATSGNEDNLAVGRFVHDEARL